MYKEFKPNVAVSETKSNQQSPTHDGQSASTNGPAPAKKGSLSKNTSFKSDQSTTSKEMESASDKKKKK